MQKQEQDWPQEMKKNVNIALGIAQILQRCFVLVSRNRFGTQALGFPCLFAVILMLLWYMCTLDIGLLWWLGLWLVYYAKRRAEAAKLRGRVHSYYDGYPFDAMRYCKSEGTAKRVVEPLMLGVLGFIAFKVYEFQGWNYKGLPYFFMAGAISVSFVAGMQQSLWQRRIQAMRDNELENDMVVTDYRDRFGH